MSNFFSGSAWLTTDSCTSPILSFSQPNRSPFFILHLQMPVLDSLFAIFFFSATQERRPRPQRTERKEKNTRSSTNFRTETGIIRGRTVQLATIWLLHLDHDPRVGFRTRKRCFLRACKPSRTDFAVVGWIRRETKCRLCTELCRSVAWFVLFERWSAV